MRNKLVLWAAVAAVLSTAGTAVAQFGSLDSDLRDALGDADCLRAGFIPGDVSESSRTVVSRSQRVDLDEDDVFLGIALANRGRLDADDLRMFEFEETIEADTRRDVDLDRSSVFGVLALGGGRSFGLRSTDVECLADTDRTVRRTVTAERDIDLDEDDILLGIVAADRLGGRLDLRDLADITEVVTTETDIESMFDFDDDDAFLALTLR